jgi:hypothetical protein
MDDARFVSQVAHAGVCSPESLCLGKREDIGGTSEGRNLLSISASRADPIPLVERPAPDGNLVGTSKTRSVPFSESELCHLTNGLKLASEEGFMTGDAYIEMGILAIGNMHQRMRRTRRAAKRSPLCRWDTHQMVVAAERTP